MLLCLAVSAGPEAGVPFPRTVVFMLDRSISMSGEPLRHAKKALVRGLELLEPQDHFAVVAFNEEQIWWSGQSGKCNCISRKLACKCLMPCSPGFGG
jgi:hypothetical protein